MTQPQEWDAGIYHRVSTPQQSWGLRVAERLRLRGRERELDAGCGSGRVTLALRERVHAAGGRVVAMDRSRDMARTARATLPVDVPVVVADLLAMPFRREFDVVFSTATLHWVLDPAALYRALADVLVPGGRLHAQCGGEGNVERFQRRAMALCATPRFAARFADWSEPWRFLSVEAVTPLLEQAGFERVRAWLEPEPTTFVDRAMFREFSEKVVLGAWMARFAGAPAEAAAFVDELCDEAAADTPAFTLDYVRLNLEAQLGEATP
jgi:trans-aconitate 2-methyltransferase